MINKGSIFKNQSPWGSSSPGSGSRNNGIGSGTRREPPNIDDLIKNNPSYKKLIEMQNIN